MQMKITHAMTHSQYELNKYSGVPWKQCSLSKSNIIFRETPSSVNWFYCKQVQEMPLRTEMPLGIVVYRGQVDKGEVMSRHRYKGTRILLINITAFS